MDYWTLTLGILIGLFIGYIFGRYYRILKRVLKEEKQQYPSSNHTYAGGL